MCWAGAQINILLLALPDHQVTHASPNYSASHAINLHLAPTNGCDTPHSACSLCVVHGSHLCCSYIDVYAFKMQHLLNMSADHQICCKTHLFCCAAQRQLIHLSAHIGLHYALLAYLVLFGYCHVWYIHSWLTFVSSVAVLMCTF
jgi:hypothetical protein